MCAAIWPGVSLLPLGASTTTVTDFWPEALASATIWPPRLSAVRASRSRALPTPSSSMRPRPGWPSTARCWPLAPVKRLAAMALESPPAPFIAVAAASSVLSAATKAATLPLKAFGEAENSTFIRIPSLVGRFFAPATAQRKSPIASKRPGQYQYRPSKMGQIVVAKDSGS